MVLRSLCVNVLFSSVILFSFFPPVCSFFITSIVYYNVARWSSECVHLYNKVPDLCVFLSQSTPNYNFFGITESRLDSRIYDEDINIPNYCISRKDSIVIEQTGIAVYIHNSIADITHRRQDLESDLVECIWLELKPSTSAPNILCIFYTETLLLLVNGLTTLYK